MSRNEEITSFQNFLNLTVFFNNILVDVYLVLQFANLKTKSIIYETTNPRTRSIGISYIVKYP